MILTLDAKIIEGHAWRSAGIRKDKKPYEVFSFFHIALVIYRNSGVNTLIVFSIPTLS